MVEGWLQQLVGFQPGHESERTQWGFCLAQLCRKSGQRALDIDDSHRKSVLAALRSDPGDLWTLSFTALTELELAKYTEALACVARVHASKHEGYASVHLIAAKSLEALNRLDEAGAEYRQYLAEDPNGSNAARARQGLAQLGGILK